MFYFEKYTASWDSNIGTDSVSFTKQSQAGHQNVFNSMVAQGKRPVNVCGYQNAFGIPQYCSVWRKNPGVAWATHHGIRGTDFQAVFNEKKAAGMRPTFIDGFGGSAGPMFNSVWEPENGRRWNAEFGIPDHDYQRRFDLRRAEGLRPRSSSPYVEGGKLNYTTVWDDAPSAGWVARHGLTTAQFNQETDRLNAQGYTLSFASAARIGGREIYAAIWERIHSVRAETRQGMDATSLSQFHQEMARQGLRLRCLSAVARGDESDVGLDFRILRQPKTNWCWATCAASISTYYGNPRTPCGVVNLDFGRTDCCGPNTDGLPCNNGGDLARVLGKIGMLKSNRGQVSFAEIHAELAAGRPVGMHLAWTGGGEHVLVMSGCQAGDIIRLSDPGAPDPTNQMYGTFSWSTHATMSSNSVYNWTGTIFTKRP